SVLFDFSAHTCNPTIALPSFRSMTPRPPSSSLFPYTTLFRSRPRLRPRRRTAERARCAHELHRGVHRGAAHRGRARPAHHRHQRSEEHTSELQSRVDIVCRLLLEKKKLSIANLGTTNPQTNTT